MNGLILYNQYDYEKNIRFAELLTEHGKACGLRLSVCFTEDLRYTPDFLAALGNPCFVINRSRNLPAARFFEKNNIRVFNSAKVCEIANDKDLTKQYLKSFAIPYTDYAVVNLSEYIENVGSSEIQTILYCNILEILSDNNLTFPLVAKPSDGHGGNLVELIYNASELKAYIKKIFICNTTTITKILFERPASDCGKDLRVYVLGNKIIAAVLRQSSGFRANFSLGASASLHTLTDEERALAEQVIQALPSDLIGIDLIYDHDHPVFSEIEDAVGCRMLYQTTDLDIAREYVSYIASSMLYTH